MMFGLNPFSHIICVVVSPRTTWINYGPDVTLIMNGYEYNYSIVE